MCLIIYSSVCMEYIQNTYFVGDETIGYEPILCYDDLHEGVYQQIGELFAFSLCYSGPAPSYMNPWVASYLCSGLDGIDLTSLNENTEMVDIYQKVRII